MPSIPSEAMLPADLRQSTPWLLYFGSLQGLKPLACRLYDTDKLITACWLTYFNNGPLVPAKTPIIDSRMRITLPWLQYFQSLP